MRQQWCGCGSKQHVLVEPQAAADRGTIAMDGRQPACVWQWAADAACVQQRAVEWRVCNSVQRQRCVCGRGLEQPAAQLQWKTVMAAGGGGDTKNSG
jgi:hypothetical protein